MTKREAAEFLDLMHIYISANLSHKNAMVEDFEKSLPYGSVLEFILITGVEALRKELLAREPELAKAILEINTDVN